MAWVFRLTNMSGTEISELPGAKNKRVSIPVNGMATASFSVRLDHPDANTLLTCDNLLQVWEVDDVTGTRTLQAHQRQVSAEENGGDDKSVACTFADPMWQLQRRFARSNPSVSGGIGGSNATPYNVSFNTQAGPTDRGLIMQLMVYIANIDDCTLVRTKTADPTPTSTAWVAGWNCKPIAEAMMELGPGALDGPDFIIKPIAWTQSDPAYNASHTSGGGYLWKATRLGFIGELDIRPTIGSTTPTTTWEYGDGLFNVKSYKRAVTNDALGSNFYHPPPSGAEFAGYMGAQNTTALNTYGAMEVNVSAGGDLTPSTLRQKLVDAYAAVRSVPRQTITFEPVGDRGGRIPRYGVDYNVGDLAYFRASTVINGVLTKRINITVRIYQVEFNIDELGIETPSLTVTAI